MTVYFIKTGKEKGPKTEYRKSHIFICLSFPVFYLLEQPIDLALTPHETAKIGNHIKVTILDAAFHMD